MGPGSSCEHTPSPAGTLLSPPGPALAGLWTSKGACLSPPPLQLHVVTQLHSGHLLRACLALSLSHSCLVHGCCHLGHAQQRCHMSPGLPISRATGRRMLHYILTLLSWAFHLWQSNSDIHPFPETHPAHEHFKGSEKSHSLLIQHFPKLVDYRALLMHNTHGLTLEDAVLGIIHQYPAQQTQLEDWKAIPSPGPGWGHPGLRTLTSRILSTQNILLTYAVCMPERMTERNKCSFLPNK